jgi:cyclophilin family peptidyl-prolyl cis-trans isomerase
VAKQAKRERQRLNREARREAELAAARRRKQWKTGRTIAIAAVPLIVLFIVLQLRSSGESEPNREFSRRGEVTLKPDTLYTATIDTSEGKMVVDLDATTAPESVKNFVFLARKNFYEGLTFHRVAQDFVIQGGDPKADGSGGPGYTTPVETPPNGYQVGSVAWAKGEQDPPGSAGSQFFVVTTAGPGLDALNQQRAPDTNTYLYGIIGTVTPDTLEVAQKIGALSDPNATDDPATQRPTKKVTIKKVTIDERPSSTAGSTPPAS